MIAPLAACTADNADTDDTSVPPPAWQEPDDSGPYGVGMTTHTFTDARGIALTVELWYPAWTEPGFEPDDYGELSVAWNGQRDAEPDLRGAPYPLVAFSHGYGGVRYQSAFLTEHLASHGFVVVAPDHPNNTLFDLDEELASQVALRRPGDVSAALDEALATWPELVDESSPVGMVGHSFGAWTSLVVGGGVLDLDNAQAHCAEQDDAACRFIGDLAELEDVSEAEPDPRVEAIVALAPGGAYSFGEGLAQVQKPLVVGGALDADLPYEEEILPVFEGLSDPRRLVTLERTGHWTFTDLCVLVDLVDCAGEVDGFMEASVVRQATMTVTAAHLGLALRADPAEHWLGPYWDDEADITIRTE